MEVVRNDFGARALVISCKLFQHVRHISDERERTSNVETQVRANQANGAVFVEAPELKILLILLQKQRMQTALVPG